MGESLISRLLKVPRKTKYRLNAFMGLESLGLKLDLVPETIQGGKMQPATSCTLTVYEKDMFFPIAIDRLCKNP